MKKSTLVSNKKEPNPGCFQQVTLNISTGLTRNDTMEGRDYTVAPMVMIVEGVLNGSDKPLYYPADELSKTPACWNHKPVVVYHPEINGQGVSACDPSIITSHKIGVIMNAKYEDGKLKAEAWLEADRIEAVDDRVANALAGEETMELSTGLFLDVEPTEGEFEGVAYSGIARNYRPDHLAILPDQTGACSVEDGAGFIRNSMQETKAPEELQEAVSNKARKLLSLFAENELSFDSIRTKLYQALRLTVSEEDMCWIEDIYESYFIYELQSKFYKQAYEATSTEVTLVGDPELVIRVTEYRSADGTFIGNEAQSNQLTINEMNKEEIINNLIANCGWSETERSVLESMSDARLQALVDNKAPEATPTPEDAPKATPEDAPVVENQAVTAEEYIASAPAELGAVLKQGLATYNKQKAAVIASIVANKNNTFTADQLNSKDFDELKSIAALATSKKPTFDGQGSVVDNAAAVEATTEQPLEMESMGY